MLEILLHEKYNFKLIKMMVHGTYSGVFISNLLAPLLAIFILHDSFSIDFLLYWLGAHLLMIVLRVFNGRAILRAIKEDSLDVYKSLKINFLLSFFSAFLYGFLIWSAIFAGAQESKLILLGILIFSLVASASATLGAVFTSYFIFSITSFLFVVTAFIYHGGEFFSFFSFMMSILLLILVVAAKKQYVMIRDSVSMDETFKNIYEGSADALLISENEKLVSCNEAFLRMFQIPSMDQFLRSHAKNYSPKYQPDGHLSIKKMSVIMRKAYKEGSVSFEWLHRDYFGDEFWCEIVLTRIHLRGKDLLYGVWRDISQRKMMQDAAMEYKQNIEELNASLESRVRDEVAKNMQKDRQLLAQSRHAQMGEMISMIAHQWRQPLAAISSTSTAIGLKASLGKLENETAEQLSLKIAEYTQHLSETIDDFRNFFKPNKEKILTSFCEIIRSVLSISDMSLRNKKIELFQELNCDEKFLSYPNELKQVVLNILKNAEDVLVERSVVSPYVKIKTYTQGTKAILEISDSGGGVSEEILEKIFDPYFSTKLQKDGTGLGLYMSKIIIEEHCGGTLSCKNIENGLEFRVELSLA